MALEEIDLTLNSLFASDNNPTLKFRDAFSYYLKNGDKDGRDRILNNRPKDQLFIIKSDVQERFNPILSENSKSDVVSLAVDCFNRLFGRLPNWYKEYDPYAFLYDGETCDRCGCNINLITRAYGLCQTCNDILEEDRHKFTLNS